MANPRRRIAGPVDRLLHIPTAACIGGRLKGTETSDDRRSQRGRRIGPLFSWEVPSVFFALVYLLLRRLVQVVAGFSNRLDSDVEVVVLRHQLRV